MSTPVAQELPWKRLEGALHAFFSGRVSEASQRDDLVQDVLLRIHEKRDQLGDADRLDAWMYRIARNALIDHHRKARPSETLPELVEPEPEPDHSRAPRVLGAYLRGRIATLPEKQREVMELTELAGLSQREAALRLDLPYSTVKSRVQRGRDALHAELLSCCAVDLDARGRVTDFRPRNCSC